MPHIQTVQLGVPQLLAVEDEVWALPVKQSNGFVVPVDAVLEVSMEHDGTFTAITVDAAGQFFTTAPFIRNGEADDCTIIVKAST